SVEAMAFPLPDKPSIAVLPFNNMSDDASQDYFADGMTDDLITDLSQVSGLFVIARNSVFAYKGKPVNVQQVSRELGVRYVLEGSVRRVGGKIRINVQLIDATTGGNVWAQRYDRDYKDIFQLQNEVTGEIVLALAVKLSDTEQSQLARMPTENLEAYDYFLRAERGVYSQDAKGLQEALWLYRGATSLDPTFARAWAGDARAAVDVWRLDWFDVMPSAMARRRAYESAGRALEINPSSARAYSVLGIVQMVDSRYDEAIDSARKAVSLKPNDADAYLNLALILTYSGQSDKAVAAMQTALRLNPKPPAGVYRVAGFILFMNRQYEKSVELLEKARQGMPGHAPYEELAMVYAQLGQQDRARAAIDGMLEMWPASNISYYRVLHAHHKRQEDLEFRLHALRKAGLPEWPFGFERISADRLDGADIERLIRARIWTGYRVKGESFVRENTDDNLVLYRDTEAHGGRSRSTYMLIGTLSVEKDMLCYRYEQFLIGRKYCGFVYRNSKGSHQDKNRYAEVNAIAVDYFTIGPEKPETPD
ncbi:MAG: tetratricopeptide repeat protein, partial [Gammaproteobacteria bacterium]|nr:tetratricopeptide repeat protein [Gammaproteobacteria bacterium]